MKLLNIIKGLFSNKKNININLLPSQGLFYKDDFKITIYKASNKDIEEYELDFNREDLSSILFKMKLLVEKNIKFSNSYNFNHIKIIDIIYIFLEIVKYTKNNSVIIDYINKDNIVEHIKFTTDSFNYYKIPNELISMWNKEERLFEIDGYKYTLPTLGVEKSITDFIINKSYCENSKEYNDYDYSFTYFLGHRDFVSTQEIDNLIQIFNFDLDEDEVKKVRRAVELLSPIQRYSIKIDDRIVELSSKINFQTIWK